MQKSRFLKIGVRLQALVGMGLTIATLGIADRVVASSDGAAIVQSQLQPSSEPFDLNRVQQGSCGEAAGVTNTSISQTNLTIPSFWWTRDQIAAQAQFGSKLVDSWLACPGDSTSSNRVDFVVNQQVWSLLDYLQRYDFVQQFGTDASRYGYNMRIYSRQGTQLAAYTCDFEGVNVASADSIEQSSDRQTEVKIASADPSALQPFPTSAPLTCQVSLDSSGRGGFRGDRANPLDGFSPRGNGTIQP
jgi:hypothetical protein